MHALDRRLITFVIRNRFPSKRSLKCLPLSSSLAISTSSFITMRDCRNSYNKKKEKRNQSEKKNRFEFLMEIEKLFFIFSFFKEKAVELVDRVIFGCSSCSKVEKIKNGKSQRIMMIRFRAHFGTAIATAKEMSGACVQNARIHHGSRWGWYRCRRFQRCSWQSSSTLLELLLFLFFFLF